MWLLSFPKVNVPVASPCRVLTLEAVGSRDLHWGWGRAPAQGAAWLGPLHHTRDAERAVGRIRNCLHVPRSV